MNETEIAARATGELMSFPSAEELRMVRAIAALALLKAARHGEDHASFRGFRVQALRVLAPQGAVGTVQVNVAVTLGGHLVDRGSEAVDVLQGGT